MAGVLTATSGTFSGTVSGGAITSSSYINVSGYVLATGTTTFGSYNSVITGDASGTANVAVIGKTATGWGGIGWATGNGIGVYGLSGGAGGKGGAFENTAGGLALGVYGASEFTSGMTITTLNSGTTDMGFSTDSGATWGKVRFRVAPGP